MGSNKDHVRLTVPLPFVHKLRMHMESCPGTNKSQILYGGLGLMLSVGLLDCFIIVYMVVGHTKLGPDIVAAGVHNSTDSFSHGQLVLMMTPYATAGAYDEKVLHTWKQGTMDLYAPIAHIMSYICIPLLADDGQVQLGDPVTQPASDFETFSHTVTMYAHEVLTADCERASARSLTNIVLPSFRSKEYHGIGRAAGAQHCQDPGGALLLPAAVATFNNVRLFTRRSADDPY